MTDKKKLTEKQKIFLDVLFDEDVNGNYKKAAMKAGYSKTTNPVHIIEPIKDEIAEAIRDYLISVGPKAVTAIVSVLDDPAQIGAKSKLGAVKEILDRAGI